MRAIVPDGQHKLSRLVNENKHRHLSPQVRRERRGLKLKFPAAEISLGPGASISGVGRITSGSGSLELKGETISGDNPARHQKNVEQTVEVWVSFLFDESGDHVLPLLEECNRDVAEAIKLLTPHLW